jgi:carbamate kinase
VRTLTIRDAKRYLADGQFPEGSMGPKIRAGIQHIEGGGDTVVITSLEQALDAVRGSAGTRVFA